MFMLFFVEYFLYIAMSQNSLSYNYIFIYNMRSRFVTHKKLTNRMIQNLGNGICLFSAIWKKK